MDCVPRCALRFLSRPGDRINSASRTDANLFEFLEQYLQRLEGPLAVQVWGRYLQLTKDMIASSKDFRPQTYSTLR